MLGQPIRHASSPGGRLPPHGQVARGRHRDGRGAHHHPDAPGARSRRKVPSSSSARVWSRSRCRTGPPSRTWLPSTGRPWASSPWIRRRWPICASRRGTRSTSPGWSGSSRSSASSTPRRRPTPSSPTRSSLNLADVVPSIAGPKRPQDRIALRDAKTSWGRTLEGIQANLKDDAKASAQVTHRPGGRRAGDLRAEERRAVVIAAITSCTNTSNPAVMLAAGLLAAARRWPRASTWRPG